MIFFFQCLINVHVLGVIVLGLGGLLGLRGGGLGGLNNNGLGLGLVHNGSGKVDEVVALLADLIGADTGNLELLHHRLALGLVIDPGLGLGDLLDDAVLLLLGDVGVLLLSAGGLGHQLVDGLAELADSGGAGLSIAVTLEDGLANNVELGQLGGVDGLGGLVTLLVQPVLGIVQVLDKLLLVGGVDEVLVSTIDLAAGVVDVLLQSVLGHLGVDDQLVGGNHLHLLLSQLANNGAVQGGGGADDGEVALLDQLLDLAGQGSILLGLGIGGLLDQLLLDNLLDNVGALNGQNTVDVDSGLDLDAGGLTVDGLDLLDREATDPGVDASRDRLGLGVLGLEIEGLGAVEGQDLGRGDGVVLVEDNKLGLLLLGGGLPGHLDGVVGDILDGEVTDLEGRRQHGALEGGTTSNSLVLVKGGGELLVEESLDALLEGGDTGGATNHLDGINIFNGQASILQGLVEGSLNAGDEVLGQLLEIGTLHHGSNIAILHDGLDVEGSLGVGGENLLELLATGHQTDHGLAVGLDVNLVLLLELGSEVINQHAVKVATTEMTVKSAGLDGQLTLDEGDNGDGVGGVANVDEADVAGLVLGEIGLGDTVTESSGGGVVDETEDVQAGDFGGIEDGAALDIGEPGGNGDNAVRDGGLGLGGSDLSHLGEVHGEDLDGGEGDLLSLVVDLDGELTVDVDEGGSHVLLLDLLNLLVGEGTSDDALQGRDGVLEVGDLLGLGSLTEVALLGAEGDQGLFDKQRKNGVNYAFLSFFCIIKR